MKDEPSWFEEAATLNNFEVDDFAEMWREKTDFDSKTELREWCWENEEWTPEIAIEVGKVKKNPWYKYEVSAKKLFKAGFWGEAYDWVLAEGGKKVRLDVDEWGLPE